MKNAKKAMLTLSSFVIGLLLGGNIKTCYELSSFKPYAWEEVPRIANCYGPEFSKLQILRAIDYWTVRGYSFGKYIHNPPDDLCKREWTTGYVIIRKGMSLSPDTLASTRRYSIFATMQGAVIRYQPGSYNLDLINEHELGHALGFTHLEIDNHIMHPRYDKMGRNFWIPAR